MNILHVTRMLCACLGVVNLSVQAADQAADKPEATSSTGVQCLALPDADADFGTLTAEDWELWTGDLHYSVNPENLAVEEAPGKGRILRQKMIPNEQGTERVLAEAYLPGARGYRLTQSVYLEPGFDYGGKNEGGKLGFGFGGGTAPTGGDMAPDGFTARFMWRGHKDGTAHIAMYSYAADRDTDPPWGDDYPQDGFSVPIGEWFELSMEVIANSSIDQADGSARAWVNGELRMQRDNISWQTAGDKPIVEYLSYSTFYGGGDPSWSPDKTTYIQFADVCWSPLVEGV